MPYSLGVDLGTTYTAAGIQRGDRLEIAELGNRSATIPSVVFMREDGAILTAESAVRRGMTEPGRLAREFKRRMGDTTPIILGGSPFSVDGLMARLLADVVASVSEREGEPPSSIAVAYPANWGQYKKDLLSQAFSRADLDSVTMITEPEAAAAHYASQERLQPGATIAVYDLGGGTFDAAVLRKTTDGFEFLGEPEGIERLGGIDFDEAVFRHVVESLRGAIDDLDADDPVVRAAVARLREDCVAAKEALSSDTDVSIPVMLPNVQTEIRLTRSEFEGMIRPALADTIVVIERAIRSAGIGADDIDAVLLVGGSSRVPLVGQIVAAELGRPIAIDVHPKHSVALGAALIAAGGGTAVPTDVPARVPAGDSPPAAGTGVPVIVPGRPDEPMLAAKLVEQADASNSPDPLVAVSDATEPLAHTASPTDSPTVQLPTTDPSVPYHALGAPERSPKRAAIVGAAVVAAVVVVGGLAYAFSGRDGGDVGADTTIAGQAGSTAPDNIAPETAVPVTNASRETTPATVAEAVAVATTLPATTVPLPAPCEGVAEPCLEITSLASDGIAVTIEWLPFNFSPDMAGIHPHFYWNNAVAAQAGTNAPPGEQVAWEITDQVTYTGADVLLLANKPPDATGICGTPGDARLDPAHSVINPEIFDCVDIPG